MIPAQRHHRHSSPGCKRRVSAHAPPFSAQAYWRLERGLTWRRVLLCYPLGRGRGPQGQLSHVSTALEDLGWERYICGLICDAKRHCLHSHSRNDLCVGRLYKDKVATAMPGLACLSGKAEFTERKC